MTEDTLIEDLNIGDTIIVGDWNTTPEGREHTFLHLAITGFEDPNGHGPREGYMGCRPPMVRLSNGWLLSGASLDKVVDQ